MRAVRLAVGALVAVVALPAAAAQAAVGDPSIDQCFAGSAVAPCAQIAPAFSAEDVEVAPDGRQVYVLSQTPAMVMVFDRDAATNRLTYTGKCFNGNAAGGCTQATGLGAGGAFDLTIAPDGKSLYVTNSSLTLLQRNPATGDLAPGGCYGAGAGCTAIAPVGDVYTAIVSADGASVYTRGGGTFGVFDRNATTGTLVRKPGTPGCFSETSTAGCTDTYGLAGNAFEMTFSPDGKFLYYPIQSPGGIGYFQRSSDGTLTQISGPQGGCVTTDGSSTNPGECATVSDGSGPAMVNAWATTMSPSGNFVLVSGSSGTVVFARAADTGKLTKVACIAPSAIAGCAQHQGSAGMGAEISPDGRYAVVDGYDISGVGIYRFDDATGALTPFADPLGCFAGSAVAGCGTFPGGTSYGKIAWAPNSLNAYSVATSPVVNLVFDAAPVCQPASAFVPFQTPTEINLSCSDPNNDPLTYQVSGQPSAGVVGGIYETSKVRYNPFSNYSGADAFQYTATARGATSAPATVTLSVGGPAPATVPTPTPTPTPAPKVLAAALTRKWAVHKTFTQVARLALAKAPVGATVTVRCAGKGCGFKSRKIPVQAAKAVQLTSLFRFTKRVGKRKVKVASKLRPGTKITIAVTSPGGFGNWLQATVRRGKAPVVRRGCLTVGSATKHVACPA